LIDSKLLLTDLRKLLTTLERDLRERCENEKDINAPVRAEYDAAKKAGRTVALFEVWREEYLTQVAVAWILGCVFVRFLEDNRLIDSPMLSGPGTRMREASENRSAYFDENPKLSDRDYLIHAFRRIEKLPAGAQLFDERHNPLWRVAISGDERGAGAMLNLWRRVDPATGALVHDFTDPEWSTRFLGDLYQDLSEEARKQYALLQTPLFVEEFILDRTLDPAIDEFGFSEVRVIDPTCGWAWRSCRKSVSSRRGSPSLLTMKTWRSTANAVSARISICAHARQAGTSESSSHGIAMRMERTSFCTFQSRSLRPFEDLT
jgi:hypothetical protein